MSVRRGTATRDTAPAVLFDGTAESWQVICEMWGNGRGDCALNEEVVGEFWYYGVPDDIPVGSWVVIDDRGVPIWEGFTVEETDGTAG